MTLGQSEPQADAVTDQIEQLIASDRLRVLHIERLAATINEQTQKIVELSDLDAERVATINRLMAQVDASSRQDAERVRTIEELENKIKNMAALSAEHVVTINRLMNQVDASSRLDAERVKTIIQQSAQIQSIVASNNERVAKIEELSKKVRELSGLDVKRVAELAQAKLHLSEMQKHYDDLHRINQHLQPLARGKEMAEGPPVVVVNSLPKSGSQTMANSLQKHCTKLIVYHHHALSTEGIVGLLADSADPLPKDQRKEDRIRAVWGRYENLKQTFNIRQDMLNESLRRDGRRPFLICGVREPISFFLSYIFHIGVQHNDTGSIEGTISLSRLVGKLDTFYSDPSISDVQYLPEPGKWMKREIVEFLSVNPFATGFDRQRGYQIYDSPRGRLLIYRMEDLSRIFKPALKELLGPLADGVEREDANTAEGKAYKADYDWVRANFKVPEALLERIYASEYARTFYTEDEIAAFRARWCVT